MLPDENPPPNLEAFRAFAQERGQEVRREYFPGGEYTDEDGHPAWSEGGHETMLMKEELQPDGKFIVHVLVMNDALLTGPIWEAAWESSIELNEAGYQRTLEEHGY